MDPSVLLDDIKLKTIEDKGLKAHDFGLGWNEQQLRIQENINQIHSVDNLQLEETSLGGGSNVNSSIVRNAINGFFSKQGIYANVRVYINHSIDVNNINITIKRDNMQSQIQSLRNRARYF
jgi:hypothetical protein